MSQYGGRPQPALRFRAQNHGTSSVPWAKGARAHSVDTGDAPGRCRRRADAPPPPPGACRHPGRGPARRLRARRLHVRRPDRDPLPHAAERDLPSGLDLGDPVTDRLDAVPPTGHGEREGGLAVRLHRVLGGQRGRHGGRLRRARGRRRHVGTAAAGLLPRGSRPVRVGRRRGPAPPHPAGRHPGEARAAARPGQRGRPAGLPVLGGADRPPVPGLGPLLGDPQRAQPALHLEHRQQARQRPPGVRRERASLRHAAAGRLPAPSRPPTRPRRCCSAACPRPRSSGTCACW